MSLTFKALCRELPASGVKGGGGSIFLGQTLPGGHIEHTLLWPGHPLRGLGVLAVRGSLAAFSVPAQ